MTTLTQTPPPATALQGILGREQLTVLIGGLLSGLFAGIVYWIVLNQQQLSPMSGSTAVSEELWVHLIASVLAGGLFAVTLGRHLVTPGAGLIGGALYGFIWWAIGPLTLFPLVRGASPLWSLTGAQSVFPLMMGLVLGYGVPLGWSYVLFSLVIARNKKQATQTSLRVLREQNFESGWLAAALRSGVGGGFAGLIGAIGFGVWMSQVNFYPLVAGLIGSQSIEIGQRVHFVIGIVIGISFGLLFRADVRGLGPSLVWGSAYGLIWWFLGPLTLMPIILGRPVQWGLVAGQAVFGSMVGHVIYGLILGLIYYLIERFLKLLLIDSDPLLREPEGPGTRTLRAMGLAGVASLAGGIAFTVIMIGTNALPVVSKLVGSSSAEVGFIVHMVISIFVGVSFGLLFQDEMETVGSALMWGLCYGLLWWFIGPLTLMPSLLGLPLHWSLQTALGAYPSLIGHLVYGAVTAVTSFYFAQRLDPFANRPSATSVQDSGKYRYATGIGVVWAFLTLLGVILPLLMSL
jgi:uncharacterized membrane protein YagU involved in acid resistance